MHQTLEIGAVLMQKDRPIAFLSKALGDSHKHKSIYEKEFLALIMAVVEVEAILTAARIHHSNRSSKFSLFD